MDKKPLSRTAQYYSKVPITKRHGGNFDIFELISKYRDYECLWNYKCLDYKNKRAKQRCWIRIARYFNTEVELVKSKMKNLRAAYLMEKKKVQKSLLAGGTPYTPNLFYYKYLSFLDDVVVLRHDLEKIDIIEHNTNDASQQGMEDEDGDEYDDIIKTEYKMETEHKMERNIQNTIDVVELIAKYKEQRCLWDCTCEDYKNLNMKQDAWESIGDSMGFEASDIKTKVKNLRSAYLLEKKKVLAAKLKGTSHIPKLFYYKNLDFLETVMVFRKAPEKDATLESTNDYKRTSASEFESDEKDQYDVEPLIKLEDNFPEILPAATGQKPHIDVYELIEKYKHYECLWNIRNKDYKNSKIRENCWSVIARHFGVEVSAVKSKVKNLRSAYVAEKKKVDKSKLLGGRPHKPYLFYYNKLTFLDKMVVMRKTADDEPILNRSNNTEQVIDFENTTSTTNDHESKNSFDESNVFEFENVDITQDGEDKAEIEHFNKSEDVELELPTIPEYSKNVSPEPTTSKVTSTRSPATRQHNKRKSKRKSKLHNAVNDIERVNVYNSFGKTIALQLKQLSLNVASITMLEVHSILTKKVLEHYRSSQNDDDDDDDSQSSCSNDEDCVDDILQAAINDANI